MGSKNSSGSDMRDSRERHQPGLGSGAAKASAMPEKEPGGVWTGWDDGGFRGVFSWDTLGNARAS